MVDSEREEQRRRREARAQRIERRLNRAKRPGQEQTRAQQAMLACFASIDPKHEPDCADKLNAIRDALEHRGSWDETDEWRISTWFQSRIERTGRNGKDWYEVAVACDGQTLSCGCPSVEKAFAFLELYKRLIIDQFYSVGPPWADNPVFEP
jgi:hypothetical protein